MNEERKHIIFLARWYPHRYDPMFGLFIQRHAEAAALFNDITVIYCQQVDETTRQQVESQSRKVAESQSRDASTTPMNNKQDIVAASMHYNKKKF